MTEHEQSRAGPSQIPEAYEHLFALGKLAEERLGEQLVELVKLRSSYINGCAFCIDMHTRGALAKGEDSRRLFTLAAWEEARNLFTGAECAALGFVDAVTRLGENGVSDEVYARVAEHFDREQIAALTLATTVINTFNRIAIASGSQPPQQV